MAVTEAERHRLYETLKSSLGPQDAEIFMNLMPPANWSEFAMKSDVAELRADVKTDIADLRTEIAELRTELKLDIADLRTELRTEIACVKFEITELRADVKDDIGELQRTLGTWLFASQAAVIATIGAVGAVTIAVLN
jgi:hypothetical protein